MSEPKQFIVAEGGYINADILCPGCGNPLQQVLDWDAPIGEMNTESAPLRCDTTRCVNKGKLFKRPTVKLEPVEEA